MFTYAILHISNRKVLNEKLSHLIQHITNVYKFSKNHFNMFFQDGINLKPCTFKIINLDDLSDLGDKHCQFYVFKILSW